jgi:hypothetical protein
VELFTIRFRDCKSEQKARRFVEAFAETTRHERISEWIVPRDILYFYHETVAIVLLFYSTYICF